MINYTMKILTNSKFFGKCLLRKMTLLVNISSRLPFNVMMFFVLYGFLKDWL